ncbi:MAG: cyclic nucleotide-binding domain-containing protein [Mariprofundaceae bacterium]|nr:cyclic nucleotide-binding domain-containing protein [Mariprofundaceae bacterium]
MDIDFTWLENNFFNTKLNETQRNLIASMIEVQTYTAKQVIVEQGSMGHALYVIQQGVASIDCSNNGESIRVATAHIGDLIGEMSFLTAAEVSATVTACEDCVIYRLSRATFSEMMKQDQELAYAVFAHLLNHTADVIRHMNQEKAAVQHYMSGSRF